MKEQKTLEEVVLNYFLSTSSIIVKDIKDYDEPQAIRLLEECSFEKQEEMYSEEEVLAMLLIKHDGLTPEYVLEQFKNK